MDDEDFLEAVEADNNNVDVVDTPVITETVAPIAVEPAIPPVEESHKPEPGFVPLAVLLDEREKRKAAEARIPVAQPQQIAPPPDVFEDPDAFASYQAAQITNVKLDLSEDGARDKHGDETVDKARDWALSQFNSRPGYREQVLSQRNPYAFIVKEFQKEEIASSVTTDDFAQFQAWRAAQAAPALQPTSPAIPPRSLASAPSAGGITAQVEQSDEDVFADIFTRK